MENKFKTWLKECDKIVSAHIGIGIYDLPDAEWSSYFEDGLTPLQGVQNAYDDYWQCEFAAYGINCDFGVYQ